MITNRTILLIDDDPQIRRVLRASLTGQRANVLDAESGEEALELLRLHTVDVVLLDLNMPGMGGLKACRAIRAAWDVPIIVLSVRDSDADKIEALDAGADDYLAKPFSFDELMAVLSEEADRLSKELAGTAKLMAKGIDLRPRLAIEKILRS